MQLTEMFFYREEPPFELLSDPTVVNVKDFQCGEDIKVSIYLFNEVERYDIKR